VSAVITVPPTLDEDAFESVIDQVAAQPADARLLVDARHTEFGTPFGLTALLCLGQSRAVRPTLVIPEKDATLSYWTKAGFFAQAEPLFELSGRVPAYRVGAGSDVWLACTSIAGSEDVHRVVSSIQERSEAILVNELHADPRIIGRFAMTLSEACQNIVEHAGRGGWVMVQTYSRRRLGRRVVEIAVCDAGIGFTASLAPAHERRFGDRWNDVRALETAIIHNQSRFPDPGRGQGFAGMKRFLAPWEGKLSVRSGTARMAIVPAWDDAVPIEEGLSSFPGAQVSIIIPGKAI
jgi:anti-sigma regulatory factor (Ser/Thr protein kinase)